MLLFNRMATLLYFPCCTTGSVCVHQEENRVGVPLGRVGQEDMHGSPSRLQVDRVFLLHRAGRKKSV